MRSRLVVLIALVAVVTAACSGDDSQGTAPTVLQPSGSNTTDPAAGDTAAPEFPDGLDWLNVARPLSLAELRGKVVVLDFWTYGCVNCMHIIPDLKRLEAEYPDELVVIGVHSAKFDNEGDTENIRSVIARYDLEHPVVNDKDFAVWNLWGARAWPTVVLIDPAGNIVGGHSGEGIYPIFQPVIDALVEEFDAQGRIDRTPLDLVLEKDAIPASVLSFPGKVLVDAAGGRLFVADTNHHRIVIADLASGEVLDVVGSGGAGYSDGAFADASFDQPQGMALSEDGTILYVADTANHAVRAVDLSQRQVATILGTGRQAASYPPQPGSGADVAISTPWDLYRSGTILYVAMAGSHQIWQYDLASGVSTWFAGNGGEGTLNTARLEAQLAQPSGLAVLPDGRVVFADSESSAIRFADPASDGNTGLLAGSDENLFDFGDVDGASGTSRLQHPLGVVYAEGSLWVADTYNSKIKRLDPVTTEIGTFAGGDQGWADGADARFSEPGGLSYADGSLYVADTNNHAIRVIDLTTGATRTMVLFGIERFPPPNTDATATIDLGTIQVAPGAGTVELDIVLPAGYKINDLAPFSMAWSTVGVELTGSDRSMVEPAFPVEIPAVFADGSVAADITVYYCEVAAAQLCLIEQVRLTATINATAGAGSTAPFRYEIAAPG